MEGERKQRMLVLEFGNRIQYTRLWIEWILDWRALEVVLGELMNHSILSSLMSWPQKHSRQPGHPLSCRRLLPS